jgi:NADPH:quinone reductase-like Zn-dependent oxidoreductase
MRAAAIDRFGDPSELRVRDLDDPILPPDGLLVRVHAAGVNPVDAGIRAGRLAGRFPCFFPLIPGWDLAGVVEQVGPAVVGFAPGDRVCAYARKDHIRDGTYAERTVVRHYHAAHVRDLDLGQAGGLPLAGLTAFQALHEALRLQPGQTVVVRGASGGVGSMAVQLAKVAGARVVAIAGRGSEDRVRELGADAFAAHDDPAAAEAAGGADALLDLVGADGLAELAQRLREGGAVCSARAAEAPDGVGDRAYAYVFVRPDGAQLAQLVGMCEAGTLRVDVVEAFGLDDAGRAHERLEGGGVHGKLLITP